MNYSDMEKASQPPDDDRSDQPAVDPAGPITVSPDPKKWRERREGAPRWLQGPWDYVFVPADPPERFATESLAELAAKLRTDNRDVAAAILAEAQATYAEPQERIESAERRATTLQGTVAIAASVALAGAGLLLDPGRIQGRGWRIAFGILLILFVICLTGCAVRALGTTTRIFNFEEPGIDRIFDRVEMDPAEILTHRAAELLRAFAVADVVGSVKVGLLRAAAWWFRWALVLLALLTILVGAYAIRGTSAAGSRKATQSKPHASRSDSTRAARSPPHSTVTR
jgi:hypothetical protein